MTNIYKLYDKVELTKEDGDRVEGVVLGVVMSTIKIVDDDGVEYLRINGDPNIMYSGERITILEKRVATLEKALMKAGIDIEN